MDTPSARIGKNWKSWKSINPENPEYWRIQKIQRIEQACLRWSSKESESVYSENRETCKVQLRLPCMVCDNGFQTEFETKTIWKGCEVCNNRFETEFETIRAGQVCPTVPAEVLGPSSCKTCNKGFGCPREGHLTKVMV